MTRGAALAVGLAGQVAFTARTGLQWAASERAGSSVIPRGYWELSLLGSVLVAAYALWLRDPVFLLGPLAGIVIYARNLALATSSARRLGWPARGAIAFAFGAGALATVRGETAGLAPAWLAAGMVGQLVWSGRFLVQWWVSERLGRSTLTPTFWWASLSGSLLLLAYAIARRDAFFVVVYVLNPLPYARNLVLLRRAVRPGGARP